MALEITFELAESDLEHFRQIMERVRAASKNLDEATVIGNARELLNQVRQSSATAFIRTRVNRMETMIAMVQDDGWGLEQEDRQRIIQALGYFSEPEDLIPDHIPGLGFLDDAIMIELVTRELEHEIAAYRDFLVFRAAETSRHGQQAQELERQDWLQERRIQLQSRMRRRRRRSRGSGSSSSGLSLL